MLLTPLTDAEHAIVARLLREVLPGSLVSRLGQRYATSFVRYVASSPHEFLAAARDDGGDIASVVIGTTAVSSLERRLLLKTPLALAAITRILSLRDALGGGEQPDMPGDAEVLHVLTSPAQRGRGHARRLLGLSETYLRSTGRREAALRTFDDDSDPAYRLYRGSGYQPVSTFEARGRRYALLVKQLAA